MSAKPHQTMHSLSHCHVKLHGVMHIYTDLRSAAEIPTLVFLTKIDAYDPDVIGDDIAKVFHSARLLHMVEVSND